MHGNFVRFRATHGYLRWRTSMRGKEAKIVLLISRIAPWSKMDGRSVNHLSVINRSRRWKWLETKGSVRGDCCLRTIKRERWREERAKGQRKDGREKENGYYFTEQISIPFDDLPWPGCITHSDACIILLFLSNPCKIVSFRFTHRVSGATFFPL